MAPKSHVVSEIYTYISNKIILKEEAFLDLGILYVNICCFIQFEEFSWANYNSQLFCHSFLFMYNIYIYYIYLS